MKQIDVTLTRGIRSFKKIPTLIKHNILCRIISQGKRDIEVTSFEKNPQFEDRDDLIRSLPKAEDVTYYAQALNSYAYEQIRSYNQIKGVSMSFDVKDTYKALYDNKGLKDSLGCIPLILKDASGATSAIGKGKKIQSRVFIENAFNPYNGLSARYCLQPVVHELFGLGADEVVLVDTDRDASDWSFQLLKLDGLKVGVQMRENEARNTNAYSMTVSEF